MLSNASAILGVATIAKTEKAVHSDVAEYSWYQVCFWMVFLSNDEGGMKGCWMAPATLNKRSRCCCSSTGWHARIGYQSIWKVGYRLLPLHGLGKSHRLRMDAKLDLYPSCTTMFLCANNIVQPVQVGAVTLSPTLILPK